MAGDGEIVFAINGDKVVLKPGDINDLTTTLNDYIRRNTRYKGTKMSCGEGGCGACAVDLARVDPASGKVVHYSANSCLRPLAAMDGWAVTTTDGLGNSQKGFHPIQEKFSGYHASQCGFCTPGMVITLYSTLKEKPNLTMEEIEARFDGNLCRCTGYRPILDCAKSFAVDSNVVDNITKDQKPEPIDFSKDPPFPEFLTKHDFSRPFRFSDGTRTYIRPASLTDTFKLLDEHSKDTTRFVAGNTSIGIYKQDPSNVFIDIQHLPELRTISSNETGLTVGAAVPIVNLIDAIRAVRSSQPAEKVISFGSLEKHLYKVANVHVRNFGTVAGNLILAKSKGFVSDISTIFLASDVQVTLLSAAGPETISFEQFLSEPTLKSGTLVYSITIPFTKPGMHFNSYKTAIRPQNSHAWVNSGFCFDVQNDTIASAIIAYGGISEPDLPGSHAIRAHSTEAALKGKPLSRQTLDEAVNTLKKELVPQGPRAEFRARLITGFFYKYFVSLLENSASKPESRILSATLDLTSRPPSSGRQTFSFTSEHGPVSKPIQKIEAKMQAAGEATYVDDMPDHKDMLFGALVTSTEARAKIVSIDATEALKFPGAVTFVTASDIPGKNNCSPLGQIHPILADGVTQFHGQPIGVVLATTERAARAAAKLVHVTYDREGKKPVITIEQALAEKEEFGTPVRNEYKQGDAEGALSKDKHRAKGVIRMGEQKHFYMEPQNAYVVLDEDGSVVVYCGNQWPDAMQGALCSVLGLPSHKVRSVQRRCGGAFGGKLTHSIHVAALTAVCAVKSRRPVRLTLDRNTDMALTGGREELRAEYDVAFDDAGKISAFKMDGHLNAGWTVDLTWFTNFAFAGCVNEGYYIPNLLSTSTVVRSNLPTRTVVRGPGEIEGSYVIENVIEHISHVTGVPVHLVRERNLYSDDPKDADKLKAANGKEIQSYTLQSLWKQLLHSSEFAKKQQEVEEFNANNRWKKRGAAMTPVKYEVTVWPKSALVNVYGDGSVLISHGGCELGQGLNTKVAQAAAYELGKVFGKSDGIDVAKIRFGDTDTFTVPNASFTGGSTGSEGAAEAARRCAAMLVERLKPVLEKSKEKKKEEGKENEPVTWEELCSAAKGASINLSAQNTWSGSGDSSLSYFNFGVAASVVELDVLTGETTIHSTDMLYDCAKSLNPAIDIGQCEGAFLMGVGHLLREHSWIDETGELVSNGTWEYKPPCARDVPFRLNIELANTRFDKGILSSKSSGEPPLVLATSVAMALRQAVRSARKDAGLTDFFLLDVPLTPDVLQAACGTDVTHLAI